MLEYQLFILNFNDIQSIVQIEFKHCFKFAVS